MLRAIIIDDESPAIEMLSVLAARYSHLVKIVGSATDPAKGIELIEDYRPDLVFLDVSMPGTNGFELLDKVKFRDFKLIFVTAHNDFAIKAIKHKAFDYLLKPLDTDDLKMCLENAVKVSSSFSPGAATGNLLEITVKDGVIYLKPGDIIRLEASGSYSTIYLEKGVKHVASRNLKEFESRLDPSVFYRCHNSHIVNLNKVQKFVSRDGFFAQMSDRSMADISRNSKDTFLERLKNL